MSQKVHSLYFWQRIVTPHMAGLAAAMAQEIDEVVYVAERLMSEDRAKQGWQPPNLGNARLHIAPSVTAVHAAVRAAPRDAIHICQGVRANGLIKVAQRDLAARQLRQWVVMETVEDTAWLGLLRRMNYRRLFTQWRGRIEGVLATGHRTRDWVISRGMPADRVYPFAYFLPDRPWLSKRGRTSNRPFRFAFVGRIVELKRIHLLIAALAAIKDADVELEVIGSGPLESELRAKADDALPGRVRWRGRLPMHAIPDVLADADCLVLPSRHDGWGAVISEALMAGTQVICSDACGAAGVVKASGFGGVFHSGDAASLQDLLEKVIQAGKLPEQHAEALADWARCLGAKAGGNYLRSVLEYSPHAGQPPNAPWKRLKSS